MRLQTLAIAVLLLAGCTSSAPPPTKLPPTPPAPVTAKTAYAGALTAMSRVDANAYFLGADANAATTHGTAANWTFTFRAFVTPGDLEPTGQLFAVTTNGSDDAQPVSVVTLRIHARAPDGTARISTAWLDSDAIALTAAPATLRLVPDGCTAFPAGAAWVATLASATAHTLAWNATTGAECRDFTTPAAAAPATSFSSVGAQDVLLDRGGAGITTFATVASHANASVLVSFELRSVPDFAGLPPGINASFDPTSTTLAGHRDAEGQL
ncbi:MAG: hypothetical protein ACYDCK_13370, partial [Thermoplasmatota archaeon]